MLGHGLTTPGVRGRPPNLWVARLPVLAIAAFAACLCAAAGPEWRLAGWAGRRPRATLAVVGAVLALVPVAALWWPTAGSGARPLPGEERARLVLVVAAAVVLAAVGAVHWGR